MPEAYAYEVYVEGLDIQIESEEELEIKTVKEGGVILAIENAEFFGINHPNFLNFRSSSSVQIQKETGVDFFGYHHCQVRYQPVICRSYELIGSSLPLFEEYLEQHFDLEVLEKNHEVLSNIITQIEELPFCGKKGAVLCAADIVYILNPFNSLRRAGDSGPDLFAADFEGAVSTKFFTVGGQGYLCADSKYHSPGYSFLFRLKDTKAMQDYVSRRNRLEKEESQSHIKINQLEWDFSKCSAPKKIRKFLVEEGLKKIPTALRMLKDLPEYQELLANIEKEVLPLTARLVLQNIKAILNRLLIRPAHPVHGPKVQKYMASIEKRMTKAADRRYRELGL